MPGGRPTLLTPELAKSICDFVRAGNFRCAAARACGVGRRTLARWCAEGRKAAEGPYRDFWHALLRAEGDAEIAAVKLVIDAAKTDPRHAEWWLSRRFPSRWGTLAHEIKDCKKRLGEIEKWAKERQEQDQGRRST